MDATATTLGGTTRSWSDASVRICLMGSFRILTQGEPGLVQAGAKAEVLLTNLALRHPLGVRRDALLVLLWPNTDTDLACQSLRTLLYGLHRLLGSALDDAPPILHQGDTYRLNAEAGVDVDVRTFDSLIGAADEEARRGNLVTAATVYDRASALYLGDLCTASDVYALIERERIRAQYLSALAWLAEYHFDEGRVAEALQYALGVLANEPCREDAHRLIMRCYVRRGERAQALRQYQLCRTILRQEFETTPEWRTTQLFDQIRLAPDDHLSSLAAR